MKNFRDLSVWKKSHQMSLKIYQTTSTFPKEEIYGLTSQMRRACVSIAANIAEGCGRGSDADFARFLQIAIGSANELEYFLLLSRDLGLLNDLEYNNLEKQVTEIGKMLSSLIKKLKEKS